MNRSKVLIIIPAFNEEKCLKKVIEAVKATKYDFVVINDGSTDGTEKILREEKVNHINLPYNLGIGGAVQTGYKYALEKGYDIAVQFDADGQHDTASLEKIIAPIENGEAELVIGSRFIKGSTSEFKSTFLRQIGIRLLSSMIKVLSGKKIYDVTSGFRAANRDIIKLFADEYPVEYPEPISNYELVRTGHEVKEVPVKMNKRIGGKSSIHSWKSVYFVINVVLSILLTPTRRKK